VTDVGGRASSIVTSVSSTRGLVGRGCFKNDVTSTTTSARGTPRPRPRHGNIARARRRGSLAQLQGSRGELHDEGSSTRVEEGRRSVTDMSFMFAHCYYFRGASIGAWNTSSVTNMSHIFFECGKFTGDIGRWNTSPAACDAAPRAEGPPQVVGHRPLERVPQLHDFQYEHRRLGHVVAAWHFPDARRRASRRASRQPAPGRRCRSLTPLSRRRARKLRGGDVEPTGPPRGRMPARAHANLKR